MFWQKWPFCDSFWSKMGENFFSKNRLEHFNFSMPNLTAKYQKKLNVGTPRYPVTDEQMNRRTDNS